MWNLNLKEEWERGDIVTHRDFKSSARRRRLTSWPRRRGQRRPFAGDPEQLWRRRLPESAGDPPSSPESRRRPSSRSQRRRSGRTARRRWRRPSRIPANLNRFDFTKIYLFSLQKREQNANKGSCNLSSR